MERRIKGYLEKAWAGTAFALLVLNTVIVLNVQSRQKEMEERLTAKMESGKEVCEKAYTAQKEETKKAIAASEGNILAVLNGMGKMVAAEEKQRSGTAGQRQARAKDREKEVKLLYDEGYLEGKEKEAYGLLKERKYAAAYKVYDEVVEKDPERLRSRYYRIYSLFYANEMNREKYDYIIQEIAYLRGKGIDEDSFKKIEAFIGRERAIEDERR